MAFKLVPAGKGMSMLQSDPMPTDEAQSKLDQLNAEAEEKPEEEKSEEPMGEMPPFGKRPSPATMPMGMTARPGRPIGGGGGGKPAMPPFTGGM